MQINTIFQIVILTPDMNIYRNLFLLTDLKNTRATGSGER